MSGSKHPQSGNPHVGAPALGRSVRENHELHPERSDRVSWRMPIR